VGSLRREVVRYLVFTRRFVKLSLALRFAWLEWTLPFKVVEALVGVLVWVTMSSVVESPLLSQRGGLALFIVLGLSVNQLLTHGLVAYRAALMMLLRGRIGLFSQSLSMIDHMMMHGVPITAGMLGLVLDGYLEQAIVLALYLAVGHALGLRFAPNADYALALASVALGVAATSGIGLLSASTTVLLKSWRGEEPVQWLLALLSNVLSGVYFPVEALPASLRGLAYLLPQTYVLRVVRGALLSSARDYGELYRLVAALAAYSALSLSVGVWSLRAALRKLREEPLVE